MTIFEPNTMCGDLILQTELDVFLPNMTKEEQIKILKEKYDLEYEFYEATEGQPPYYEHAQDAYFGALYLYRDSYKLDKLYEDLKKAIC